MSIPTWAIPTVITVLAFVAAIGSTPKQRGDYDFSPILGCAYVLIAAVVALASWLAWSLL